ncbi:DMT family transporter [Paenirhodobacter enshiensis]|uniref:DMT family transporter n=1 Tax=Paenirhodobacter enshiensis TaxID=1105367 RepID=UPI0035B4B853
MIVSHSRRIGIALVLASAVLWSTAGPFVRMAGLDVWSILGWRSLFSVVVLGGWMLLRPGAETRNLRFGLPGAILVALTVVANATYIMALSWTSVANVMTVYATLPFVATAIAFLWLGDRVTMRFIIAGLMAFGGVCAMVGASFSPADLRGIAAAAAMTLFFAAPLVVMRRYPNLDTLKMVTWAALCGMIVAVPLMPHDTLPSGQALLACALYGVVTTGLGYILVLIGGRIVGAGEAGFLSMLDVVLGPLWMWIFFDETVSATTLAGGATVLGAVLWYLSGGRRRTAAPA